ncbi:MAG: hypothetical protein U0136_08075 [Bdellovibrionota bacterium]
MKSITLAFSLIRVPKLFVTLLFWPLLAGLGVAGVQIICTSAYIKLVDENVASFQKRVDAPDKAADWVRMQIFGTLAPLEPIRLCRWTGGPLNETPPDETCVPEPLDVAMHVDSPATFDASEYLSFFEGSVRKFHLCQNCRTDINIRPNGESTTSDVYSLQGLGIYALTESAHERDVRNDVVGVKATIEHLKNLAGTVFFHPVGFKTPINITKASTIMILVLNTAFLIIITLWLSLVGHRKVLQYFARNDALLPLVAACGKGEFYASLWLITLLRVSFFLFASLPATCLIYVNSVSEATLTAFMGNTVHFMLWISCIISSLGAMTIIASIAELKQRHSMVSFFYKYIPVLCFLIGTATWVFTLFNAGRASALLQYLISALPLLGLSPMILAPLFRLDPDIMALHTFFASVLVVMLLRMNSRWFAAHLEDI